MLDKDLQPLKASRSMVVTDCGIVRLVNDSQRSTVGSTYYAAVHAWPVFGCQIIHH